MTSPSFLSTEEEVSLDFPDSGIRARTTPAGHRVVEIDFWAIASRRKPSWRKKMEASLGLQRFKREFLRNWTVGVGDAYYPEFADLGQDLYIHKIADIPKGITLFRGFDFGIRHPVCIWGGYSLKQDRIWVFREFDPMGMLGTHHFRDAVAYLSGDFQGELEPLPRQAVDQYAFQTGLEAPWFAPGLTWESISGPESGNTQANAARDPRDATAARILAAAGIWLIQQAGPVKARHEVLRRFLHVRPDGFPGLLIDPSCETLLQALNGGLTYAKETASNPLPDRPRKDGRFDDVIDALTYAVCALVPAADRPLARPAAVGQWLPQPVNDPEELDLYETRGDQSKVRSRGWDSRTV